MLPKRIHINRCSLSPFTGSAIIQLFAEWNRKADAPEVRKVIQIFEDHAEQLEKMPIRPSKPRKRTASDIAERAAWFAANRREVRDEIGQR